VHDIDDDLSATALRFELESVTEEKAEVENKMRALDKDCQLLRQQLATFQGKYSKVQDVSCGLEPMSACFFYIVFHNFL